jgi:hypothetical protein
MRMGARFVLIEIDEALDLTMTAQWAKASSWSVKQRPAGGSSNLMLVSCYFC